VTAAPVRAAVVVCLCGHATRLHPDDDGHACRIPGCGCVEFREFRPGRVTPADAAALRALDKPRPTPTAAAPPATLKRPPPPLTSQPRTTPPPTAQRTAMTPLSLTPRPHSLSRPAHPTHRPGQLPPATAANGAGKGSTRNRASAGTNPALTATRPQRRPSSRYRSRNGRRNRPAKPGSTEQASTGSPPTSPCPLTAPSPSPAKVSTRSNSTG
jgi:hypothetical protein